MPLPAKARALNKKSTQREFNNINTNNLPTDIGYILGGLIGSAGGTTGFVEGAKYGVSTAENLANRTGWNQFYTKPFIPLTETQAREKFLGKKPVIPKSMK